LKGDHFGYFFIPLKGGKIVSIYFTNGNRLLSDEELPLLYKLANFLKELKEQMREAIYGNFEIKRFDNDNEFIDFKENLVI
jgi:hypothetical protein